MKGCTGQAFTEAKYTATVKTTGAVGCSVLTSTSERASGTAKVEWAPKAKPATSTGPVDVPLDETPSRELSGE